MTTTKFRGFSKNFTENDWFYGDLINYSENEKMIYIQNSKTWDLLEGGIIIDEKSIGKFTGKHDCNGNEIYSDDIIEFDKTEWGGDDNIHLVSWDEKNAVWNWGGGITSDMEWRRVIGNKFQNPDLIEENSSKNKA